MFLPRLSLILALTATTWVAAAETLSLNLELKSGTSDCPMIVAWLEDTDKKFVRTLYVFTKHKEYFKDLSSWMKAKGTKESDKEVDAVIGPTIKWKGTGVANIPIKVGGIDMLSGKYSIRVEQNKDKGGHYKSTRIALPQGYTGETLNDVGYLKTLTLTVK